MSSLWGLTEMVLEGGAANDVYALLSRAKEECASEERDHCSEVIHTVKGDFCFALGLENIYEDTGDGGNTGESGDNGNTGGNENSGEPVFFRVHRCAAAVNSIM